MKAETLAAQLSQFGLNPNDWVIHKMKGNLFKVHATTDENFCFIGKTKEKDNSQTWQYLKLVSI